ncbi:RusA family crossover junction endodeoxyribonuclease [Agrococcus sp. DT81.2]|uniref:RusA family crossover junction endodeoxyribonuclease n=1 Tax=Agrococcus sp. DT81.2 TaxID=3393414 RepID=UPI003CE50E2C
MRFFVAGTAAPQGSKRGFSRAGSTSVQMVESSKNVKPWREDVRQGALAAMTEHDWTAPDAVRLGLTFWMPRPKSHPKTRRTIPSTRPDLDKLIRAVGDALTSSGAVRDDSTIVKISASKAYIHPDNLRWDGEPQLPGVDIHIQTANDGEMPDV